MVSPAPPADAPSLTPVPLPFSQQSMEAMYEWEDEDEDKDEKVEQTFCFLGVSVKKCFKGGFFSFTPVRRPNTGASWINSTPFRTCSSVCRALWTRQRRTERGSRSGYLRQTACSTWARESDRTASLFLRSTFNWTVPFLSWLAITALCLATVLLYLIPLRYLVLAWGEPCSLLQQRRAQGR